MHTKCAVLLILCGLSQAQLKQYYVERYKTADFFKAYISCSQMGMDLLRIEDEAEYGRVHGEIEAKTSYSVGLKFWTAGASTVPLHYNWMDTGYPVGLKSKWAPGEPNFAGGIEDCVHLWLYKPQTLVLNDAVCYLPMHYICQSRQP